MSDLTIAAKVKILLLLLCLEVTFYALFDWLHCFKKRHEIRDIGLYGTKLSGDHKQLMIFNVILKSLCC